MSEPLAWLRQIVLQTVQQCLRCQQPFQEQDIHLLGQMGETYILSIYCRSCQTLVVIGLAISSPSAGTAPADEEPLVHLTPIGNDDLLEMHLFLDQFDGDFRLLFKNLDRPTASETPPQ